MPEYIERRRVSNACYEVFEDVVRHPKQLTAEEVRQTLLRFERAINGVPAADVAPVKHGRWTSLTECSNAGVYCSVCHKKVWREDYAWCNRKNKLRSNYCPNCGARMDGE